MGDRCAVMEIKAEKKRLAAPGEPCSPVDRGRGTVGFDGLERISTQTLLNAVGRAAKMLRAHIIEDLICNVK
jgi:hypothetical protein